MPSEEQAEAQIVNELKKRGLLNARNIDFKVRKDFYDTLKARGMSQAAVNAVVGSMTITVPEEAFGGPIYVTALDTSVSSLYNIWKAYCEDMSESIFISIAGHFNFVVPF